MTIASGTLYVRDGGNTVAYDVEIRNPAFNTEDGTVSVEVHTGNREGFGLIVQRANYTLESEGTVLESSSGRFKSSSFSISKAATLTGPVDLSRSKIPLSVTVSPTTTDSTETISFEVEPPAMVSPDDITINCTSSPGSVVVGEEIEVTATVNNSGSATANVNVAVTMAGASDSKTVSVPKGGSVDYTVTFAPDSPGEYQPTVSGVLQ